MNKISLSKSVFVSKENPHISVDFYEKICGECYRLLKNYINPRSNVENVLDSIEQKNIEKVKLSLIQFIKSYYSANDVLNEFIQCRANKTIEVSISNIEILKADSNCYNCEFIIHFISKEFFFHAFVGNSVIISQKYNGTNTVMVDFNNKEVSVESVVTNENSNTIAV